MRVVAHVSWGGVGSGNGMKVTVKFIVFFPGSDMRSSTWNVYSVSRSTDSAWPDALSQYFLFLFQDFTICWYVIFKNRITLLLMTIPLIPAYPCSSFVFSYVSFLYSTLCWIWEGYSYRDITLLVRHLSQSINSSKFATWAMPQQSEVGLNGSCATQAEDA